jgi:hypothetical protein
MRDEKERLRSARRAKPGSAPVKRFYRGFKIPRTQREKFHTVAPDLRTFAAGITLFCPIFLVHARRGQGKIDRSFTETLHKAYTTLKLN